MLRLRLRLSEVSYNAESNTQYKSTVKTLSSRSERINSFFISIFYANLVV